MQGSIIVQPHARTMKYLISMSAAPARNLLYSSLVDRDLKGRGRHNDADGSTFNADISMFIVCW